MQWLIDALREPAAAVVAVLLNGLTLALVARVRGAQRQNAGLLGAVLAEQADARSASSSTP